VTESITAPYPEGCQGAVSLTFDDGLRSQLEVAVPVLNDRKLRATFYLNPRSSSPDRDDWLERLAPWREVARQGHELGNHSISHLCSRAFGNVLNVRSLETVTLEELETDILEAERRLRALTGVQERTFAYPCYQDFLGEGLTRQSYVPVIARHFAAGRGRGEVANHPLTCDLHHVWSFPVERMAGPELVGLAERAASQGRWVILTLHGIHEGHLPIADVDFRELCDFLACRKDIWVAPAADVARRIREWRKTIGRK